MAGSKVRLWKQDPTVTAIRSRAAYIHTPVEAGPQDGAIKIEGMPDVRPNAAGDFLFSQTENPKEFDSVHTFTVVRQVLTMYQRALRRMQFKKEFSWQWGKGLPLGVWPRAGEWANAYYSRGEKALRFFYFHPGQDESRPLVFTCRSFDIVAHETGHAILDALRPGYWNSKHPQTGGLHESFGDLTDIFTMLAQMDQCEAIIAESKADLHAKTFFSAVAEQFGEALGRTTGLRNADNDLRMSQVSNQVHELSQVFTGAVYDILADIFDDYKKLDEYDPAETLFRIGKHMTSLVVYSLLDGPKVNATYQQIADKMIEIEPVAKWKDFIRNQFARREVLGAALAAAPSELSDDSWAHCCGTLQHPEHLKEIKKAA